MFALILNFFVWPALFSLLLFLSLLSLFAFILFFCFVSLLLLHLFLYRECLDLSRSSLLRLGLVLERPLVTGCNLVTAFLFLTPPETQGTFYLTHTQLCALDRHQVSSICFSRQRYKFFFVVSTPQLTSLSIHCCAWSPGSN